MIWLQKYKIGFEKNIRLNDLNTKEIPSKMVFKIHIDL
jgi:hypothetical protein